MWTWPVEQSHITYTQELHWRLAAKWNNISFERFLEYEGDEQSALVATYETAMQIEAVASADANRQSKRKQPHNRRR